MDSHSSEFVFIFHTFHQYNQFPFSMLFKSELILYYYSFGERRL